MGTTYFFVVTKNGNYYLLKCTSGMRENKWELSQSGKNKFKEVMGFYHGDNIIAAALLGPRDWVKLKGREIRGGYNTSPIWMIGVIEALSS